MVRVEQIQINLTLPTDRVSVVSMQPYLDLQENEPFKLKVNTVAEQLEAIRKTLNVAQKSFDDRSAHFTVFPEYSIPGIDGLEVIEQQFTSENWSNGSVIIAGVHGLTKEEYDAVFDRFDLDIANENRPLNVPDDKWVNCCFTWIKEDDGEIRRFIQLKIRPAWEESNVPCNEMFCGSIINVFNCRFIHEEVNVECRFTTFICFDWVAPHDGSTVRDEMLRSLQEQLDHEISLHWIFVIQHNNSPNHTSFLHSTVQYLTDPENKYPNVRRNEAVVFHLNTAANIKPLKISSSIRGGFSACIIAPTNKLDCNGCRPTVCMQPYDFRGSKLLKENQIKDIVFREIGECIHRFQVRVPRFLVSGAPNRTHPIQIAEVHALKNESDPRLSGKQIPASLKWFNDSLDEIKSLAEISLAECQLYEVAKDAHTSLTTKMRLLDGKSVENQINWTACTKSGNIEVRTKDRCKNPDFWDGKEPLETKALEHIVHTLTNLGIIYELEVGNENATFHGALNLEDRYIQVVTIQGQSYSDCRYHYDNYIPKNNTDPVIVVLSDAKNHKPTPEELKKCYETNEDAGEKIISYHTLVSLSRETENAGALKEQIDEHLPTYRRII